MSQPNDGVEDEFYKFKSFRVPKYQIKFEKAAKLSDIQGYVWYSPAALYLWGRFTETNLAEIISRTNIKIFWYKFDKPIFDHFGPEWNHLLWAASVEDWPKVVDAVLETVQFDIPLEILYQYALQEFSIIDPLSVDKARVVLATTPEVPIQAFAVLSNKGQTAFNTKAKAVRGKRPSMSTFKPQPVHQKAAKLLFAGENLTQDGAFQRYKSIMGRLADASYSVDANDKHQEFIRRHGS